MRKCEMKTNGKPIVESKGPHREDQTGEPEMPRALEVFVCEESHRNNRRGAPGDELKEKLCQILSVVLESAKDEPGRLQVKASKITSKRNFALNV